MKLLNWKNKSIAVKILLPVILLMIIMVILIDFTVFFIAGGHFEKYIKDNGEKNGQTIASEIENYKDSALQSLSWFENSPRLAEAFLSGDRELAVELGRTAMDSFGLEYMVITDLQGNVFIRAHDPENFGDSIANQVNIQTALNGEKNVQIENGKVVKFSIRAGTPLKDENGNIIGAVSTGTVLGSNETAERFSSLLNKETIIFEGPVAISSTIGTDDPEFLASITLEESVAERTLDKGEHYYGDMRIGGEVYTGVFVPFKDVSGEYAGVLFSGELKSIVQSMVNAIGMTISAVVAIITIIT